MAQRLDFRPFAKFADRSCIIAIAPSFFHPLDDIYVGSVAPTGEIKTRRISLLLTPDALANGKAVPTAGLRQRQRLWRRTKQDLKIGSALKAQRAS